MDVRGKKVLVFGDSLSASDSSPGGVLAARLRDAGAIVRRNGRVSRSAVNLFSGKNGENGAAVIAAEVSYRPDIVLVVLGTNDMGLNAQADAAAFARIRDAFAAGGAKVYAVGPPAFSRTDHARESVVVYDTLARVFGAGNVIDWRALSGDQVSPPARAADLVHFTTSGAAVAGQRLAGAVLAHRVPLWGGAASPRLRAWWPVPVTAAVAAAGLIGAAVYVRRRRRLAGIAGRGVTKREGTGFYTGTHRGRAFELVKVQGHQAWYWRIPADNEGGEDWFSSKREALDAVKDWIDQRGDAKLRGPGIARTARVRRIGRDYPREVVHGTTHASAKAFIEGRDLHARDRKRTLSEFGDNVIYVAEKTAPHQALMFGTHGGRTLIELTLDDGREVLDLAPEIQRRPFVGEKTPLAFKGRPSFTDDMGAWLAARRAARGMKPLPDPVGAVDPTSSSFYASEYPSLLASYVRDRGYAGMRFTDETVLVDRDAIMKARKLKKREVDELKRVERKLPAVSSGSLYTRDFEVE